MLGSNVDLRDLAKGVLHSCPPLTQDDQRLIRAGQCALIYGLPLSVERLGRLAGLPADATATALERLPGLARLDGEGRIVGLLGLSVQPTPHRFDAGGRLVYTWCAWDALFIPRVIGRHARVASRCPITSALLRLVVAPDGVLEASPPDIAVSFLLGCEPGADQGIVGACCPHIHFLSTAAAGDRWLSGHPAGLVLTLVEAWQLGRLFVDEVLFSAIAEVPSEGGRPRVPGPYLDQDEFPI